MPAEPPIQVQFSFLPHFSLSFQYSFHSAVPGGASLYVDPIEMPIDEIEEQLASANLRQSGITISILRDGMRQTTLVAHVHFRPPPADIAEVLEGLQRVIVALSASVRSG